MSKQQAALDYVVELCRQADPDCGIRLQGSVARGQEQPDSDIDLTVVLSQEGPRRFNRIIREDNHFGMRLIPVEECGVQLDINWLRVDELLGIVRDRGAFDWWMFHQGRTIHDPAGLAKRCQDAMAEWFERHPAVAEAWRRQEQEVQRHKQDASHPLAYANQPAFCAYLRSLPGQEVEGGGRKIGTRGEGRATAARIGKLPVAPGTASGNGIGVRCTPYGTRPWNDCMAADNVAMALVCSAHPTELGHGTIAWLQTTQPWHPAIPLPAVQSSPRD